ncbi:MAG: DUF4159 domain-containing protein [Planctomycetales bacterium]
MKRLLPILGLATLAALATSGPLPRQRSAEGGRQKAESSRQYAVDGTQSAATNISSEFRIHRRPSDPCPLAPGFAGERARVRGLSRGIRDVALNFADGLSVETDRRAKLSSYGTSHTTAGINPAAQFAPSAPERMTFAQWNERWERDATTTDRRGVPKWEIDVDFRDDVFTFVRIKYDSLSGWQRWATDYPDSDLNFSYRVQELTSLKVDPHGKVLELTDPELFDHPFIYLIEPGAMRLTEEEVVALRRYLRNGGFLMVDDFWGEAEWDNFHAELKRVFPQLEPVELPLEHPIFHCVYDLKEKPQVPSIGVAQAGRFEGTTWEREDAKEPHYRGLFDEQGRLMAVICHNTDLGDGWEREGEDEWYFREFSEKKAYPLGINILFYAMTH